MKPITDFDRHTILVLIRNGLTTKEIGSYMKKEYTRQQIAAIRAWETMTSGKPKSESKKIVAISDADKAIIIKFLKKKLDNEKIQEKMSWRYSRQQIAAINAWITMGKY